MRRRDGREGHRPTDHRSAGPPIPAARGGSGDPPAARGPLPREPRPACLPLSIPQGSRATQNAPDQDSPAIHTPPRATRRAPGPTGSGPTADRQAATAGWTLRRRHRGAVWSPVDDDAAVNRDVPAWSGRPAQGATWPTKKGDPGESRPEAGAPV